MKGTLLLGIAVLTVGLVSARIDEDYYDDEDTTTEPPPPPQCEIPGECIDGHELEFSFETSLEECLLSCQKVSGSTWITFDPDSTLCQCLESCDQGPVTDDSSDCENCVSSETSCEVEQCFVPGLCRGEILDFSPLESSRKCLSQCTASPDCQWFSLSRTKNLCLSFKDCSALDETEDDFLSGQSECIYPAYSKFQIEFPELSTNRSTCILAKVLVTTGEPMNSSVTSEVIDLLNPDNQCDNLGDFVAPNAHAIGALISETEPLICGGHLENQCIVLGHSKPKFYTNLTRSYSASTQLNDGQLVISGGYPLGGPESQTTEVFTADGQPAENNSFVPPTLPKNLRSHCMVTFAGVPWIIGGFTGENEESKEASMETFFEKGGLWFNGPDLINGRGNLACAVFESQSFNLDQVDIIVVAGGEDLDGNIPYIEMHIRDTPFFFRGNLTPPKYSKDKPSVFLRPSNHGKWCTSGIEIFISNFIDGQRFCYWRS